MTKAAVVMVCGGEKNCYYIFSILMFGEEAVCPDGLFVPAVFRESDFYLNSLNYAHPIDVGSHLVINSTEGYHS
jgi:hypothetical protein